MNHEYSVAARTVATIGTEADVIGDTDPYGAPTDPHQLVLAIGGTRADEAYVLTGTLSELEQFARRVLATVEGHKARPAAADESAGPFVLDEARAREWLSRCRVQRSDGWHRQPRNCATWATETPREPDAAVAVLRDMVDEANRLTADARPLVGLATSRKPGRQTLRQDG